MIVIDSLHDPRLAAYANLKDKELARDGRRFIAEGEQVVRRLLASTLAVESVLVSERKAAVIGALVGDSTAVFAASDEIIQQVIGFEFHSGVLACGVRPEAAGLEIVMQSTAPRTVVVCPKIMNPDNLGAIIRIGAAFGVTAMILGQQCCDPYFRHSVRVSMGTVFKLPIVRSDDLLRDLNQLQTAWDFELVATVLDVDARPLAGMGRKPNLALVFGDEAYGLDRPTIEACDTRVIIPMRRGTDSLNVSVAAGIFLYHFVDVCGTGAA